MVATNRLLTEQLSDRSMGLDTESQATMSMTCHFRPQATPACLVVRTAAALQVCTVVVILACTAVVLLVSTAVAIQVEAMGMATTMRQPMPTTTEMPPAVMAVMAVMVVMVDSLPTELAVMAGNLLTELAVIKAIEAPCGSTKCPKRVAIVKSKLDCIVVFFNKI